MRVSQCSLLSSPSFQVRLDLANVILVQRCPERTFSRLSFMIKSNSNARAEDQEIYLCAETQDEMEDWIDAIHVNTSHNRLQVL
jgi:hypothetical protein